MLNKVILIGRLVADPESSTTSSGVSLTKFRIAVDRNYKNQQGEIETDFINITTWRKTAELVAQYCHKGMLVAVDGRLQVRTWQTPEGDNRRMYEVVAEDVRFLDRGGSSSSGSGGGGSSSSQNSGSSGPSNDDTGGMPPDDDSLPF